MLFFNSYYYFFKDENEIQDKPMFKKVVVVGLVLLHFQCIFRSDASSE